MNQNRCPSSNCQKSHGVLSAKGGTVYDNEAKTDYAINEDDFITDTREGPVTLQEGDSGQPISYQIDARVHRCPGNRQDGKAVDHDEF